MPDDISSMTDRDNNPEYSSLPDARDYLMCFLLGGAAFLFGWLWFSQTKRGFSDVL